MDHSNKETPTPSYLSAELARLALMCDDKSCTYGRLTQSLSSRGHAVLTMLLAVPFLQPVPIPGLSIGIGLTIFAAGVAMACNRRPWIPFRSRTVSTRMARVFRGAGRFARLLERWIKPRGRVHHEFPWVKRVHGVTIALCGLLLALPLPPGTNFPPALTILFLSMASLEDDGLFMVIGYLTFVINILLFTGLYLLGVDGVRALLS